MTTKIEYVYFTYEKFNEIYCLNTNSEMGIEEFSEHIEENEINYFYISCCNEDVENAIKEEEFDTNGFNYVNVDNTYYFAYMK